MKPAKIAVVFLLLAQLFINYVNAYSSNVSNIKIIEYGLFEVQTSKQLDAKDTSIGNIDEVKNEKLIKSTNNIIADVGTRFGVRYVVEGDPRDGKVDILVKVLHPSIRNPETKNDVSLDQWTMNPKIGKILYTGWSFDYPWEVVPGEWTIQIWHDDRKLVEQSFTIHLMK